MEWNGMKWNGMQCNAMYVCMYVCMYVYMDEKVEVASSTALCSQGATAIARRAFTANMATAVRGHARCG